ncbi:MAG: hypothetical protein H0V82_05895 [Candidatus Protochlamydia sp.]|nr:hypothetical protein [Candidatus Protochlamydia sp.]
MFSSITSLLSNGSQAVLDKPEIKWNKAEGPLRHFRILEIKGSRISGSGQFTGENITNIAQKISTFNQNSINNFFIIDVRMEFHAFINDLPMEWKLNKESNLGLNAIEILCQEKEKLIQLTHSSNSNIKSAYTEEELVISKGHEYIRLPTLDHYLPDDKILQEYLDLLKSHPDAWFHVHCHVGKGRTTVFMAIYHMFLHAKEFTFEEIVQLHKNIGGEDFLKHIHKTFADSKKQALAEKRLTFLQKFYQYCSTADLEKVSWNEWIK